RRTRSVATLRAHRRGGTPPVEAMQAVRGRGRRTRKDHRDTSGPEGKTHQRSRHRPDDGRESNQTVDLTIGVCDTLLTIGLVDFDLNNFHANRFTEILRARHADEVSVAAAWGMREE